VFYQTETVERYGGISNAVRQQQLRFLSELYMSQSTSCERTSLLE